MPLSLEELVGLILKYFKDRPDMSKGISDELKGDFSTIVFHSYNSADLAKFSKDISSGMNIQEALNNILLDFQFKPDFMLCVSINTKLQEENPYLKNYIIYHSFLSWIRLFYNSNSSESVVYLLETLLRTKIDDENLKNIHHYSFFYLISHSFKCSDVKDFSLFCNFFAKFLQDYNSTPDFFAPILVRYLRIESLPPKVIYSILYRYPEKTLMSEIIRSCFKFIELNIASLDVDLLLYLSMVLRSLPDDDALKFYDIVLHMFQSFITIIKGTDPYLKLELDGLKCSKIDDINYEIPQSRIQRGTLTEGMQIEPCIQFPEKEQIHHLIRSDILVKISTICRVLCSNKEIARRINSQILNIANESVKSPHVYDILSALLYILLEFQRVFDFLPPIIFLVNRAIFNPAVTIYNSGAKSDISFINTLRTISLEHLAGQGLTALKNCFQEFLFCPCLFSEICHRLMSIPHTDKFTKLTVSIYSDILRHSIFLFLASEPSVDLNRARVSLFHLLNYYFQSKDILSLFLEEKDFVDSFFNLIYEDPVREYIFNIIVKAFEIRVNENFLNKMRTLISRLFTENEYELINEFLDMINTYFRSLHTTKFRFSQRRDLGAHSHDQNNFLTKSKENQQVKEVNVYETNGSRLFESLVPIISTEIPKLSNTEEDIVIRVIDFLTYGGSVANSSQLAAFETAIRRMHGNKPSKAMFDRLIQLLAGEELQDSSPTFLIKAPKVLKLIIGVFSNSDMLNDVFLFITKLCEFSKLNCEAACSAGLDICLIELINSSKTEQSDKDLINTAISLLMIIFKSSCSISGCNNLISILCPIEGRFLSNIHPVILRCLTELLNVEKDIPLTSLPYTSDSDFSYDISFPDQGLLLDNFIVSFWFKFEELGNTNLKVLTFDQLIIYMSLKSIVFVMNYGRTEEIYAFDFPLEKWFLVTVTLKPGIISVSVENSTQERKSEFQGLHQQSKLSIGGLMPPSIGDNVHGKLGPLGIFSISDNKKIADAMHRALIGATPSFALIFITAYYSDGLVNLVNGSSTLVKIKQANVQTAYFTPFPLTLAMKSSATLFIPIFAQWDLMLEDGTAIHDFYTQSIKILSSSLSISLDIQKQFAEENGIEIIGHLLASSKNENISFSLYLEFYSIFSVLCDPTIKQQLAEFLFDPSIWLKSTATDHLSIVYHWRDELFKDHLDDISPVATCTHVLNMILSYYWHNFVESSGCLFQNRCRGEQVDIKECRNALFDIALVVSSINFMDSDFQYIISQISTHGNYEQSIDILKFLKRLIPIRSAIDRIGNSQLVLILMFLFNLNDDRIIIDALSILLLSHECKLFDNLTLDDHIDIILHNLGSGFIKESLFTHICSLLPTYQHLFPLAAWMAINIGNTHVLQLISSMPANSVKSEYITNSWMLWLVILLYKIKEINKELSEYICIVCANCFNRLLAVIDIVGLCFSESSDSMKRDMITVMMHLIDQNKIHETDFVLAASRYIFYHDGMEVSSMLKERIMNSVYCTGSETKSDKNQPENKVDLSKHRTKKRNSFSYKEIQDYLSESKYNHDAAEEALSALLINIMDKDQETKGNRRVSVLSIDNKNKSGNVSYFAPNKPSVIIMPQQLDSLLRNVVAHEFNYVFGLNVKKNEWVDSDIARRIIEIHQKYPKEENEETITLILAFLHRFGIHLDYKIASNSAAPYYNITVNGKGSAEKAFHFITTVGTKETRNETMSFTVLKDIMYTNINSSKKSKLILGFIDGRLISISSNSLAHFVDTVKQGESKRSRLWNRLWSSLTTSFAPWYKSLPGSFHIKNYKKDFSSCVYGIQPKLKVNRQFNDHLQESLIRDTGDENSANQMLETLRNELEKEYTKSALSPLMEIGEIESTKLSQDVDTTNCLFEIPCEIIKISNNKRGTFALLETSIVITIKEKVKIISLKEVKSMLVKPYLNHNSAIEILLFDGRSYFVNFLKYKSDNILRFISSRFLFTWKQTIQLLPFRQHFESLDITSKWASRAISNFQYIMHINTYSGRSFNSASTYPIFPWIISDYKSSTLNINDLTFFRDLTKPIGALSEERLLALKEKFAIIKQMGTEGYLYSSGPVHPLAVYLWLIRMEPFTTQHILIQGGRFDHAARIFNSISDTWNLVTTSQNDFRELIPEFYFMPEFLLNTNKFDLGSYNNVKVNDVVLPNWAKDVYDFIYKHRKALESEIVSHSIHKWFDLIFGCKQKSQEDDNIYKPELYPKVWNDSNRSDPEMRSNIEAILSHVGQMPQQIFDVPHVKRDKRRLHLPICNRPVHATISNSNIMSGNIAYNPHSKHIKVCLVNDLGYFISYDIDPVCITRVESNDNVNLRSSPLNQPIGSIAIYTHEKKKSKMDIIPNNKMLSEMPIEVSQSEFTRFYKQIRSFEVIGSGKKEVCHHFTGDNFLFGGIKTTDLYRIGLVDSQKQGMPPDAVVSRVASQRSTITALVADTTMFATANSDGLVYVYKQLNKPSISIHTFTDRIRSIAINKDFHILVIASNNSTLLYVSLSSGQVVKVFELPGKANDVIITPKWGFVLVYLSNIIDGILHHYIHLYSINGDLINSIEVKRKVKYWTSFSSPSDFDFIVIVDDDDEIYLFEAFYLDINQKLYKVSSRVITIEYIYVLSTLCVMCEDGKLLLLPFVLDE